MMYCCLGVVFFYSIYLYSNKATMPDAGFPALFRKEYFRLVTKHYSDKNTPLGHHTDCGPMGLGQYDMGSTVALILPPLCFLYEYFLCTNEMLPSITQDAYLYFHDITKPFSTPLGDTIQ